MIRSPGRAAVAPLRAFLASISAVLAACAPAGTAPPPAAAPAQAAAWPAPAAWPPPWPAQAPVADPVCPSGSAWSGTACVRTLVVNEVWCPPGSAWDGGRCVGALAVDCPAGTQFVEGSGCVAVPAAPPSPPAPSRPSVSGVVDPWSKPRGKLPPGGVDTRAAQAPGCGCAAGDLMCAMKCQSACKNGGPGCPPPPSSVQNTARPFDRSAAVSALAAAAAAARGCTGVPGSGMVRVTFEPSGKASSATVQGPPFAGTPQGACIAAVFRDVAVPPFDGAQVAVSKSVAIP